MPENKGRVLKKLAVYSTAVILVSSVALGAGVWLTDVNVPVQYEQPFSIRMSDEERYDPNDEVVGWQTISFKSTVERPYTADFSENDPENQYYTYVEIENPREDKVTIEVEVREPSDWSDHMSFTVIKGIVDPDVILEEDEIEEEDDGSVTYDIEVEDKIQYTVIYELGEDAPDYEDNDHEIEWEFREKEESNEDSIWLGDVIAPITYKDELLLVDTHEATDIDSDSATLNGELTYIRGYDNAEVFFRWRELDEGWDEIPEDEDDRDTLSESGLFDYELDELEEETSYEFKAVAEADDDEYTGDVVSFFTLELDEIDGSGEEDDPYRITDLEELQAVQNDLSAYYVLCNNIDASETKNWNDGDGFLPIGDEAVKFHGYFDGRGKYIEGLHIDRPEMDNVGLFGHVGHEEEGQETIIENVHLKDVDITGGRGVGALIGRVTGNENTSIEDCSAQSGTVEGTGATGGLVGSHNSWRETPGGIDNPVVSKSYANITVSGRDGGNDKFGGLAGCTQKGEIVNSYALGNVNAGSADRVGGLVGCVDRRGEVITSYSTGKVDGDTNVGGLVGNREGPGANVGRVTDSYWDTKTSATEESDGGTGLTTEEMTGEEASNNMFDFDFEKIWETAVENDDVSDDGYPILQDLDRKVQLMVQEIYSGAYFRVEIDGCYEEVEQEDTVTVEYTVENIGTEEGTQDIVFSVDGDEEDREEDINLEKNEEHSDEFVWEAEDAGEYILEVASDDHEEEMMVVVTND